VGDGEGERLRQRGDLTEESLLALRLLEDVLLIRPGKKPNADK